MASSVVSYLIVVNHKEVHNLVTVFSNSPYTGL